MSPIHCCIRTPEMVGEVDTWSSPGRHSSLYSSCCIFGKLAQCTLDLMPSASLGLHISCLPVYSNTTWKTAGRGQIFHIKNTKVAAALPAEPWAICVLYSSSGPDNLAGEKHHPAFPCNFPWSCTQTKISAWKRDCSVTMVTPTHSHAC